MAEWVGKYETTQSFELNEINSDPQMKNISTTRHFLHLTHKNRYIPHKETRCDQTLQKFAVS